MLNFIQQKLKPYTPLFLRFGLGAVFLLFAFNKLSNTEQRQAEIQLLLDIGIGGASAMNFYLGITELLVGLSFILGAFIKYTGLIGATLIIIFFSGLVSKYGFSQDPTLNRDLGLLAGAITLWLLGAGRLSVDSWMNRKTTPPATPQQ
jgi:uncharacterized membrane protein YphA (DoxX/SURF4 family)